MQHNDPQELAKQAVTYQGESATTLATSETPVNTVSAQAGCLTCQPQSPDSTEVRPPDALYALGRIEARFPNLGIEKECAQTPEGKNSAGLTDRRALHTVLSAPHNRYLCRHVCWVMTVETMETYILKPRDTMELEWLIDAIRPTNSPMDVDVVVGQKGPIAPPDMCNGLMLPMVALDQVYSFDIDSLVKKISTELNKGKKKNKPDGQLEESANDLFLRIMQMADNAGATPQHRALNYLAISYSRIYEKTAEMYSMNYWLKDLMVRPSRLSTTRTVVDVIFTYIHRQTEEIVKYFARVDVTDRFPFLVTPLSKYYLYDQFD